MSLFNLNEKMIEALRVPEPHISEIGPQVIGVAAWNSMVAHNSTSRTVMDSNHIASSVSLLYPEKKKSLISGVEYELGKYIDDFKVDEDSVVVGIIQKIVGDPNNPRTGVFLEYEKEGELWLDYIEIPTYKTKHSFFGYQIHKTEIMKEMSYGTPIKAGSILGKTNSLHEDGSWMPGFNANVAFMTVPETGEDGIMVSESLCDRMKFTSVTSRVAYLDKNTMPVNIHGDENEFKMFPSLGETVKDGYPLFATRDRNDMFIAADLNNRNIMEIDWNFDNLQFTGAPGSKVVDIEVVRGSNIKPVYSDSMTEQLDYWYDVCVSYAKRTVNQYDSILRDYRNKFGASFVPRETGRLITSIRDHLVMEATEREKRKTSHDDHVIDQYRIKITVESIIRPNVGYKITGIHGDKGTITSVKPDHEMPYYPGTNIRAEIVIGGATETTRRMNPGRAFELEMGALNRDNRGRIIDALINKYGPNFKTKMTGEDYREISLFLRGYYRMINPDMIEFLDSLNEDDLEEHIDTVIDDWLYIYFPTSNKYNINDVLDCIEDSPYRAICSPVTYVSNGEVVTTTKDVLIGVMYFLLLDRISRDYSGVSSAKVNNFMLPVKGSNSERNSHPHNLTPVTNLCETGTRYIAGMGGLEMVAEMYDTTLNPTSHKQIVKNILESEGRPSAEFDIDRSHNPYGGSKPLELLMHVAGGAGIEFVYTNDDDE